MLHVDPNIFWTVVNLLILFILLRIFLFKPVLGMIEKRKAAIEGTLSDADQKNAAAQALKQQYESSLKDAKQESFQIVSDAKDRAQVQYNQIIDKANADASQIVRQAKLPLKPTARKSSRMRSPNWPLWLWRLHPSCSAPRSTPRPIRPCSTRSWRKRGMRNDSCCG